MIGSDYSRRQHCKVKALTERILSTDPSQEHIVDCAGSNDLPLSSSPTPQHLLSGNGRLALSIALTSGFANRAHWGDVTHLPDWGGLAVNSLPLPGSCCGDGGHP